MRCCLSTSSSSSSSWRFFGKKRASFPPPSSAIGEPGKTGDLSTPPNTLLMKFSSHAPQKSPLLLRPACTRPSFSSFEMESPSILIREPEKLPIKIVVMTTMASVVVAINLELDAGTCTASAKETAPRSPAMIITSCICPVIRSLSARFKMLDSRETWIIRDMRQRDVPITTKRGDHAYWDCGMKEVMAVMPSTMKTAVSATNPKACTEDSTAIRELSDRLWLW
mmetsp:Transcript_43739/g.70318  ORF Transcript_43739/g.70318 Transcript_43739/m.70318 type:complete len:224 (-) Transcript_43739:1127-1798(-)